MHALKVPLDFLNADFAVSSRSRDNLLNGTPPVLPEEPLDASRRPHPRPVQRSSIPNRSSRDGVARPLPLTRSPIPRPHRAPRTTPLAPLPPSREPAEIDGRSHDRLLQHLGIGSLGSQLHEGGLLRGRNQSSATTLIVGTCGLAFDPRNRPLPRTGSRLSPGFRNDGLGTSGAAAIVRGWGRGYRLRSGTMYQGLHDDATPTTRTAGRRWGGHGMICVGA